MMQAGVFSAFETEASMCVWEWLINQFDADDQRDDDDQKFKPLFEGFGWSAMRCVAMQAGKIVAELYNYADTASGMGHLTEDSFDWEFVPMICARLDWELLADDNQYKKGEWRPDTKEFLSVIIAAQALNVPA